MPEPTVTPESLRERMGVEDAERLACPRPAEAPAQFEVSLAAPTAVALVLALVAAIA